MQTLKHSFVQVEARKKMIDMTHIAILPLGAQKFQHMHTISSHSHLFLSIQPFMTFPDRTSPPTPQTADTSSFYIELIHTLRSFLHSILQNI